MTTDEVVVTIISGTVLFLILVIILFVIVGLYQRRKIRFLQETSRLKTIYEKEILTSQIEVQNQTLQRVGQDLHDNIGQLLALAKMQLSIIEETTTDSSIRLKATQTYDVIGEAVSELRALTKSLDGDFVKNFGLVDSLAHELERLQKTVRLKTEFTVSDQIQSLGFQREIVIFRIIQELINNTLKYSGANKLTISVCWTPDQTRVIVQDNGKGFDYNAVMNLPISQSGAGLRNIQKRLELIGGSCRLITAPGEGVRNEISINTK